MKRVGSRVDRLERRVASRPRPGCPECGPSAPTKFTVVPPRVIGQPVVEARSEPEPCSTCGREIPCVTFVVRAPRLIAAGDAA